MTDSVAWETKGQAKKDLFVGFGSGMEQGNRKTGECFPIIGGAGSKVSSRTSDRGPFAERLQTGHGMTRIVRSLQLPSRSH